MGEKNGRAMNDETYDTVKSILAENERLFMKLQRVAEEYDAIEFDESGFYIEKEQRCERHWETLARKVAEALQEGVEGIDIRVLKNSAPNIRSVSFDITAGEGDARETTRLSVDYAAEGSLAITRA